MSRILYLDCFSGVSGDMLLGALIDAGLPVEALRAALGSLPMAARPFRIVADRVSRAGIAATKFRVIEDPGHHAHHHHSLRDIEALIDRSALSVSGKARATALFRRLAETEADIHQLPVEEVHLHEVGALDSIVDIVGAVFGLEWFGTDEVVASALNVGSGMVDCAHGSLPVPAPATARLLTGVPVYAQGPPGERVTPTGALLITGHATSYGLLPAMRIEQVGYGAGDREMPSTPNVLRVFVGTRDDVRSGDRVGVLEFEVDDMNPQIFGTLMDRLYGSGALDVFYAPVQMKKNRPGTLVTVLVPPPLRESLSAIVFRETTTIGLRYVEVERECLDREVVPVETPLGPVRFKLARRAGTIVNVAAEFDDCVRLADEHRVSVKDVQALAMKAYLDRGR